MIFGSLLLFPVLASASQNEVGLCNESHDDGLGIELLGSSVNPMPRIASNRNMELTVVSGPDGHPRLMASVTSGGDRQCELTYPGSCENVGAQPVWSGELNRVRRGQFQAERDATSLSLQALPETGLRGDILDLPGEGHVASYHATLTLANGERIQMSCRLQEAQLARIDAPATRRFGALDFPPVAIDETPGEKSVPIQNREGDDISPQGRTHEGLRPAS